jgi:hypothetical protein
MLIRRDRASPGATPVALAGTRHPGKRANGDKREFRRIGGRSAALADGILMAGRRSLPTGSGVPAAAPLITPSRIGEARPAGGVIRSPPARVPCLYSALTRWAARAMSRARASLMPLRYPIPNPTAQPAAAQPKTRRQTRAASIAHTIEASAERSQVTGSGRRGPTTNRRASRAIGFDAGRRRKPGRRGRKSGRSRADASFSGLGWELPVPMQRPRPSGPRELGG